jgi:hypothetical protein
MEVPRITGEQGIITPEQALEAWKQIMCTHGSVWTKTTSTKQAFTLEQARAYISPYLGSEALKKFSNQYEIGLEVVRTWEEQAAAGLEKTPAEETKADAYAQARSLVWIGSELYGNIFFQDFAWRVLKEVEVSGSVDAPVLTMSVESQILSPRLESDGWPAEAVRPEHAYYFVGTYTLQPAVDSQDPFIAWQIIDYDVFLDDVTWTGRSQENR